MKENDLFFFALVCHKKSFTKTAHALDVAPSTVSKRVARIEDRLGVILLNRTTRNISLTSEGERFLNGAKEILADIDTLENTISQSKASGLLKVNCTFQFGRDQIAPAISEFSKKYPAITIQLDLSDTPFDMVREGYDLSIRFGWPGISNLVVKRLLKNKRIIVTSPDYISKNGAPLDLESLKSHQCVLLRQESLLSKIWRFDEQKTSIKVNGLLATNDGDIAVKWVLDGHGIMLRSVWDVAHHIKAGRLKQILPDYFQLADVFAVYPEKHNLSTKVRLFVDFLNDYFSDTKKQEFLSLN